MGLHTIGLTGEGGGSMAAFCNVVECVPSGLHHESRKFT